MKSGVLNNPMIHYAGSKEKTEDDLLSISVVEMFSRYPIQSISTTYRGHQNLICVKAYDREFVVKPYNGKQDWELMLKILERAKYGVFTTLERTI